MSNLPTKPSLWDEAYLNEGVLVAYEAISPIARMNNVLGDEDKSSAAPTRVYVRRVRRHTCENDDRLVLVDEDSVYHHEDLENLKMGEETVI